MTSSSSSSTSNYEHLLLKVCDCFVYKIPPLRTATGHRAEDWNLEKPLFVGYLKVFQQEQHHHTEDDNDIINKSNNNDSAPEKKQDVYRLFIRVYQFENGKYSKSPEPQHLKLFAECMIELPLSPQQQQLQLQSQGQQKAPKIQRNTINHIVEEVIDSSRYFVLRIQDFRQNNNNSSGGNAEKRTAMLGIGFQDRDQSLDLKNVINDFIRYVDRMTSVDDEDYDNNNNEDNNKQGNDSDEEDFLEHKQTTTSTAATGTSLASLSLGVGEKIQIKHIGKTNINKKSTTTTGTTASTTTARSSLFLPPPPAAATATTTTATTQQLLDDEDWTDFSSA